MTPLRGTRFLVAARRDGRAIAAFSVYNLEQAEAVCAAAGDERAPILLQAGSSAFRYAERGALAALSLACAQAAAVPVGVHLDHATDLDEIDACLAAGYGSVMYDGSALPLERNIEGTRRVVERAHAAGAWVEGELAGIAGDEDASAAASAGALTDPASAERFVRETGVDALAIAIGNVHGISATPPVLDFERLERIRARVDVPLVLHGASGLSEDELRRAVALGVAKVNVNTELRRAFRQAVTDVVAADPSGDDIASLLAPAREAVRAVARSWIRVLADVKAPA